MENVIMRTSIDPLLKFWLEAELSSKRCGVRTERDTEIANILRQYEQCGDAMRYRDTDGKVSWKATPQMLQRLAEQEREVRDDYDDEDEW